MLTPSDETTPIVQRALQANSLESLPSIQSSGDSFALRAPVKIRRLDEIYEQIFFLFVC